MNVFTAAKTRTEAMQQTPREAPTGMPLVLIHIVALACGLLLALAVHIVLIAKGVGLTAMFQDIFATSTDQLKAALAWWAIGLAGCLGSWGTIVLLRRTTAGRSRASLLPVGLALLFFCLLTAAGYESHVTGPGSAVTSTAANFASMALGGFMAFFAAHFAARR